MKIALDTNTILTLLTKVPNVDKGEMSTFDMKNTQTIVRNGGNPAEVKGALFSLLCKAKEAKIDVSFCLAQGVVEEVKGFLARNLDISEENRRNGDILLKSFIRLGEVDNHRNPILEESMRQEIIKIDNEDPIPERWKKTLNVKKEWGAWIEDTKKVPEDILIYISAAQNDARLITSDNDFLNIDQLKSLEKYGITHPEIQMVETITGKRITTEELIQSLDTEIINRRAQRKAAAALDTPAQTPEPMER